MNELFIHNIDIYTEQGWIRDGALWIEDRKIKEVITDSHRLRSLHNEVLLIDGKNLRAIPGFIDSHIHGASGADVMDGDNKSLSTIARALPKEGTTRFVATTLTAPKEHIDQALETVASYTQQKGEARIEGIHVEGPFIAEERAGAQPKDAIIPPDAAMLSDWQDLAKGNIKTITLAPELDTDSSCIKRAIELGINVSAGHTSATYTMMKQAVTHGVRQVTHLCNAMPGIHHRDVGVIGAVTKIDQLTAELIVDGIHVSDEMVEMVHSLIGTDRMMLITDGMRAKNMDPGTYDLGGQSVHVTENFEARLATGSLAGSIVQMNEAARRMSQIEGVSWEDVIQMTSYNPAKRLGIFTHTGSITSGKDADIILVDDTFEVYVTLCQGEIAYHRAYVD